MSEPMKISTMGKHIWLLPMGISVMGISNYCILSDINTVLPRWPIYYPFAAPLLLRCYPRQLQTRPNLSFPYIIVMPEFLSTWTKVDFSCQKMSNLQRFYPIISRSKLPYSIAGKFTNIYLQPIKNMQNW